MPDAWSIPPQSETTLWQRFWRFIYLGKAEYAQLQYTPLKEKRLEPEVITPFFSTESHQVICFQPLVHQEFRSVPKMEGTEPYFSAI